MEAAIKCMYEKLPWDRQECARDFMLALMDERDLKLLYKYLVAVLVPRSDG